MPKIPDELIDHLNRAERVVVVTGAGTSAESGVPTFRDALTGLWAKYDPAELATPQAFRRDPALVWQWYCWRRSRVLAAEPNAGHRALVELQQRIPQFQLVTQNVDGLHQRAGSRDVVELHGCLLRARCLDAGHVAPHWPEPDSETPPPCTDCGSPLRPDVVWFGEPLPDRAIIQATGAAQACDVFFSIGTSSVVYPAAGIVDVARRSGAVIVEINPDTTPLSNSATYALQGPSGQVLPEMVRRLDGGSA